MKRFLKSLLPKTTAACWLVIFTLPFTTGIIMLGMIQAIMFLTGSDQLTGWVEALFIPFALGSFFFFVLLHNPFAYYLYLGVLVGSTLWVLFSKKTRKAWKLIFGLIGCLILLASLQYQPVMQPIDGYSYQLADRPFLFEAGRKTIGGFAEGKECEYEILGWQQSILYYDATCRTGKSGLFAFDAVAGKREQVDTVPDSLLIDTTSSIAIDLFTPDHYNWTEFYIKSESYDSADSQYAAVILQYVYGPQDIIVLEKEE